MKYLCPFHSFYWTTLFRGNQVLDLSISHLEVSCISARWNRKLMYIYIISIYIIHLRGTISNNVKHLYSALNLLHNLMAMVTTSFHVNVSPQEELTINPTKSELNYLNSASPLQLAHPGLTQPSLQQLRAVPAGTKRAGIPANSDLEPYSILVPSTQDLFQ